MVGLHKHEEVGRYSSSISEISYIVQARYEYIPRYFFHDFANKGGTLAQMAFGA